MTIPDEYLGLFFCLYRVDILNYHVLPNVICSGVISTREAKARNQLKSYYDQYLSLNKVVHQVHF